MASRRIIGISGAAAAVGIASWAQGRIWRDKQADKQIPVKRYGRDYHETDTLIVYFGGAFSKPSVHARNVIHQLGEHGTVLVPEYDLERYNHRQTYESTYSDMRLQLQHGSYRRLLVTGASTGAINAFRLAGVMNCEMEVSVITPDPLLTADGMKTPARKGAGVLTKLHPGPIMNPIMQPLTRALIPGRDQAIWEVGVEDHVHENLESMRDIKMSGYLDFAQAILDADLPCPSAFDRMNIIGMFSEHDPTLDATAALLDFYILTELADTSIIKVPGAQHVTFPEQPKLWSDSWDLALARALN